MTTYADIIGGVDDELQTTILDLLLRASAPVSRRELVRLVTGHTASANLSNDPDDRRNRKAIERLRAADWPIMSDPARGGYWLETCEETIIDFAARMSRIAKKYQELSRQGYSYLPRARALREAQKAGIVPAKQLELLPEGEN